jgi:hypothetical protein
VATASIDLQNGSTIEFVIASEAKQSIAHQKESWIASLRSQ